MTKSHDNDIHTLSILSGTASAPRWLYVNTQQWLAFLISYRYNYKLNCLLNCNLAKLPSYFAFSNHPMYIHLGFEIELRDRKSKIFAKKLDEQTPVSLSLLAELFLKMTGVIHRVYLQFFRFSSASFDFEPHINMRRMFRKQISGDRASDFCPRSVITFS